jgi:cytochrome c
MNFFDNAVLPQSAEHIQLLHYLMVLIQFLFLPFLSVILIGTFISLKYWKKGLKGNNSQYIRFSKDVLDTISVSKSLGAALGILPVITSILIYAQLLHKSNSSAILILTIALPLLILGFLLTYTFKYSLTFNELFDNLKQTSNLDQSVKTKVGKFGAGSGRLANRSGIIGLAFLAVGSWYYISAISSAVLSEYWEIGNQIEMLFSLQSILSFIQFLVLAVAVTGSAILFAFFYWEGGKSNLSDGYKKFVKKISLTMTMTSLILLPAVLFVNNLLLPKTVLSGSVFAYLVIAVILIFFAYHILYAISKTSNLKLSGQLFFVLIFLVLALVIKDQMAMSNSTKLHSAILSSDFDKYLSELKGESTSTIKVRSGEEIFQVVCSACHKFDQKLVGPPYNTVLTKYEGKMDQLVRFILNPVKVDPAYPPMPNQGLRREEAKNIAEYLMGQHSKSAVPKLK